MVVNGKVWPYLAVEVQIYVLFILGMFLTNYNYSKKSFELFNNNNELKKGKKYNNNKNNIIEKEGKNCNNMKLIKSKYMFI